ncbi:protease [Halobacillus salinarum]|uniref:Protease n=1 Tax=Halobacillus salinarum TaxID=2932257 RepID=A0ABY4EHH9_9BACI|nr:NfeD family protein [Halobacillus salinarum]UOQ42932.1 protease [Halobacillus salinarum]
MTAFFWGCLIFGLLFALLTVVVGDLISDLFDGMFEFLSMDGPQYIQPMVVVGFITTLGGSGILLHDYTSLPQFLSLTAAILIGLIISILVYFLYVKPMNKAESSTGFSYDELKGKAAEVTIAIPAQGYGEIMLVVGGSNTTQIAQGIEKEAIPGGEKVVIVDVEDHTALVTKFNEEEFDD